MLAAYLTDKGALPLSLYAFTAGSPAAEGRMAARLHAWRAIYDLGVGHAWTALQMTADEQEPMR